MVAAMLFGMFPTAISAAENAADITEIICADGGYSEAVNSAKNYTNITTKYSKYAGAQKENVPDTDLKGVCWTVRGTLMAGGTIKISFAEPQDFSRFRTGTYLEFGLYCSAANVSDVPTAVRLYDSAGKYAEKAMPETGLCEHNDIKLCLGDFKANDGFDFGKVSSIRFSLPQEMSGEGSLTIDGTENKGWFNLYTDNMRITRGDAAVLSVDDNGDGSLSLTAETNCENPKYRFLCNGARIGESQTGEMTFTPSVDGIYTFRVEVYSADGKLFAADDNTRAAYTEGTNIFGIVDASGNFTSNIMKTSLGDMRSCIQVNRAIQNWKGYAPEKDTRAVEPLTGSQKWVMRGTEFNSAMWRIHFNEEQDFSDIRIGGYLSFLFYSNAETKEDLPVRVDLYSDKMNDDGTYNSKTTSVKFPCDEIKLNEWNLVKLYFQDFSNVNFDFDAANRIEIPLPAAFSGLGDYDGDEAHAGWFDVCIGNMYVGYDLNFQPKTYSAGNMISDSDYDGIFENSVVMAAGTSTACVDGLKTYMGHSLHCTVIDNRIYVLKKFAERYLGLSENADVCEIYYDGEAFVSADDIIAESGAVLTEKNGTVVFSDEEKELTSAQAKRIADVLMWQNDHVNNGAEGFVTGMITHPKDATIMYCRTDVGGCYRWDERDQEWKQLMLMIPNDERNLMGVLSMAVDPNDTDVVYALCGTFSTGSPYDLMKSEDRGETWHKTYLNKKVLGNETETRYSGERIAVDPNNSDIIYVGTNNDGLWYSENGGLTWKHNEEAPAGMQKYGINAVLLDPSAKTEDGRTAVMYISVYGDGLYKSTDAGASFEKVEGSPEQVDRMHIANGKLYIAAVNFPNVSEVTRSGVFVEENGELIDISPGEDVNKGVTAFTDIMIDYTNPNFLVAAGWQCPTCSDGYNKRFRSYDGGKTWERWQALGDIGACCLVQDGRDPKRVYEAHGRGLWMYENIHAEGTMGWTKTSVPMTRFQAGIYEDVALKTESIPAEDAPLLLIGDYDAGFMIAEDKTTLATMQTSETSTWKHYGMTVDMDWCEASPKYFVRVGKREGKAYVTLSEDYGRLGVLAKGWDTDMQVFACAAAADVGENGKPVILVAVAGEGAGVYRSADWGVSWTKVDGVEVSYTDQTTLCSRNYVLFSDSVDKNTFYFCDGTEFYTSTDGGLTWEKKHSFESSWKVNNYVYPNSEGSGWHISNGDVFVSEDRGTTWEKRDICDNAVYLSFGKGKSDMPALYLYGTVDGKTGIYLSDNLGEDWQRIDDDSNNYALVELTQITGDAREYGTVYVSTGGYGVLWFEKNDETESNRVSAAEFIDGNGKFPLSKNKFLVVGGWSQPTGYPSVSEIGVREGECSTKWTYKAEDVNGYRCVLRIDADDDKMPEIGKNAVFEFDLYIEDSGIITNKLLPNMISFFDSDDNLYKNFDALNNVTGAGWYHIEIPMSKFAGWSDSTERISVDRIELMTYTVECDEDFSLYLSNMRFSEPAFEVSDVSPSVGETVEVSTSAGAALWIAAYGEDGALMSAESFESGTAASHSVNGGEKEIKAMLFDSVSGMKPLTRPFVIDVE